MIFLDFTVHKSTFCNKKSGLLYFSALFPHATNGYRTIMTECTIIILRRQFEILSNISAHRMLRKVCCTPNTGRICMHAMHTRGCTNYNIRTTFLALVPESVVCNLKRSTRHIPAAVLKSGTVLPVGLLLGYSLATILD